MPEFSDYVNGMGVQTSSDSNGYLWGAYLNYGTQVDRTCRKFLGFTFTAGRGE